MGRVRTVIAAFVLGATALPSCTNQYDGFAMRGPAGSSANGAGGASSASSSQGGKSTEAAGPGGSAGAAGGAIGGGTSASTGGAGGLGGAGGDGTAGGPPVVSCNDQYGSAPSYIDCGGTATECTFGFNDSTQPCSQICGGAGGECVETYNDTSMCGYDPGAPVGCNLVGLSTAICICSHGCGGSPPCVLPKVCVLGDCL